MKWKGLTLIELLVVITILSLLAGVVVVTINPVQQLQKGRDFKRKSDISSIQTALEQYRHDQSGYPPISSFPYILGACGAAFKNPLGTISYLSKIPCDPAGGTAYNSGNYYYYSNGTTYTLVACLENASDADAQSFPATLPTATGCSSTKYYVVTNQ